ncbi:MAG: hypothetical protein LBG79_05090 [Spirochaetaceae bacterium]|jgi:hypothetical protein|nr:hypothetical protein [Spirochaetaceae bacterium]
MKRLFVFQALLFQVLSVYAADPFINGDMFMLLGHPKFIVTANSAAGGPLFSEGSYSINMNPALSGGLQFPALDFGYTGILHTGDSPEFGGNLHLGASIPTRMGVVSIGAHGLFDKDIMGINSGLFRLGLSRDLTSNFYLGLSVWGGIIEFGEDNDFAIAADVGAWYRIPQLLFLKNIRFGAAVQNIGKSFIYDGYFSFPSMFTPKLGIAFSVLQVKMLEIGLSADVALPSFLLNITANTGLQINIANLINVYAGWDFNLRETAHLKDVGMKEVVNKPYIAVGVKLKVDTSGNNFMHKHSLNEMVLDVDTIWQKRYENSQLFSVGGSAVFGERDNFPPVIQTGEVRYTE